MTGAHQHEDLLELCAAHALGCLDPADAVVLQDHLREGCEECEAEIGLHRSSVELLGLAVEPVPPPAGAEERVLAIASAGARQSFPPAAARRRRPLAWALPLAAMLVATIAAGVAWQQHLGEQRLRDQLEDLEGLIQSLTASQNDVFELTGDVAAPAAEGYVIHDINDPSDPHDDRWHLHAEHLQQPTEAGTTYKAWLVTDAGTVDVGTVDPLGDGHAVADLDIPDFQGTAMLELTLEKSTSPAPLGPVILRPTPLKMKRDQP